MVRETRYLLVRNIPEKSTEESINHYFQRWVLAHFGAPFWLARSHRPAFPSRCVEPRRYVCLTASTSCSVFETNHAVGISRFKLVGYYHSLKVQHFIDRMSTFCLRFSSSGLPLRIMLSSVHLLQVLRDFFSFFLIFFKVVIWHISTRYNLWQWQRNMRHIFFHRYWHVLRVYCAICAWSIFVSHEVCISSSGRLEALCSSISALCTWGCCFRFFGLVPKNIQIYLLSVVCVCAWVCEYVCNEGCIYIGSCPIWIHFTMLIVMTLIFFLCFK